MHAFSLAVLRGYSPQPLMPKRVLPAREMKGRVSMSLRSLLKGDGGEKPNARSREVQFRHLGALNDVGQLHSILCQNIARFIDLWKAANITLMRPEPLSIGANAAGYLVLAPG